MTSEKEPIEAICILLDLLTALGVKSAVDMYFKQADIIRWMERYRSR